MGLKRLFAGLFICWLVVSTTHPQNGRSLPAASKAAPVKKAPSSINTPAEKVHQVLQDFYNQWNLRNEAKNPPELAVRLTENEVNAYLREELRTDKHPGLKAVAVKFIRSNYVGVTTTIDFEKVKLGDSSPAMRTIRPLLAGDQQIYLEGSVTSGNRTGQFRLEKAYLGSVRLPVGLIEKLVKYFGPPQDPPVELSKPYVLPYGLKKVEIETGTVMLRG